MQTTCKFSSFSHPYRAAPVRTQEARKAHRNENCTFQKSSKTAFRNMWITYLISDLKKKKYFNGTKSKKNDVG